MLVQRLEKWFLEHPETIGESYVQHLWHAGRIGVSLFTITGACLVHALIPVLFVNTASNKIRTLAAQIDKRLSSPSPATPTTATPTTATPTTAAFPTSHPAPLMMAEKSPEKMG